MFSDKLKCIFRTSTKMLQILILDQYAEPDFLKYAIEYQGDAVGWLI